MYVHSTHVSPHMYMCMHCVCIHVTKEGKRRGREGVGGKGGREGVGGKGGREGKYCMNS